MLSGEVTSHAQERAVPAKGAKSFPVILFSHGGGSTTFGYTALIECLVSHGYIVARLNTRTKPQRSLFRMAGSFLIRKRTCAVWKSLRALRTTKWSRMRCRGSVRGMTFSRQTNDLSWTNWSKSTITTHCPLLDSWTRQSCRSRAFCGRTGIHARMPTGRPDQGMRESGRRKCRWRFDQIFRSWRTQTTRTICRNALYANLG